LVEQLIRNQQVIGSSPIAGSSFPKKTFDLHFEVTCVVVRGHTWVTARRGQHVILAVKGARGRASARVRGGAVGEILSVRLTARAPGTSLTIRNSARASSRATELVRIGTMTSGGC
jgi:hypothetical protein